MSRALWPIVLDPAVLLPHRCAADPTESLETPLPVEASKTPLPEAFGPLDWSTTAESLRARFPEAQIEEGEPRTSAYAGSEDGRELLLVQVTAHGAHLEPFGTVDLSVMGFQGHPPAVLVIQRSDSPQNDCYGPGTTDEQAEQCWERLDQERRAVYDPIAAQLLARHGPGGSATSRARPSSRRPTRSISSNRSAPGNCRGSSCGSRSAVTRATTACRWSGSSPRATRATRTEADYPRSCSARTRRGSRAR